MKLKDVRKIQALREFLKERFGFDARHYQAHVDDSEGVYTIMMVHDHTRSGIEAYNCRFAPKEGSTYKLVVTSVESIGMFPKWEA